MEDILKQAKNKSVEVIEIFLIVAVILIYMSLI